MKALWLGTVRYDAACGLMAELANLRAAGVAPDCLLLLEHPPTITLGRGADRRHILLSPDRLAAESIVIHDSDRGGDVTYHGPGQLVGYPILDLGGYRRDLHWYLRQLEEVIIRALVHYGLGACRFPPNTGVWVDDRKIAAIGIKVSRWITTHGFALNVTSSPADFRHIVPCGLSDYGVTSIRDETGNANSVESVARRMALEFADHFDELSASQSAESGWSLGIPESANSADRVRAASGELIDSAKWEAVIPRLSDPSRKILSTAIDMSRGRC